MTGLHLFEPTGAARRWVRLVWEWDGYVSGAAGDRILPHGLCEVSWELARGHRLHRFGAPESFRQATLIGPSTNPYWVHTPTTMHLFGMVFVPGTARSVLGSSIEDVRDRFYPFEDSPVGRRLVQRVSEASRWEQRVQAVKRVFDALPPPAIGRATSALLRAWSESPDRAIKTVRGQLGMSAPTFVKQVRQDLGLRPAEVRQVVRFRGALARVAEGGALGAAALDAGYADQAHMTRAFRRFAGLTPRQVRPRSAAHPFHVPETRFPFVQDAR